MFQKLADDINDFLAREILAKHPDDRTKKEDLLLETGRAFADGLARYSSGNTAPGPMAKTESVLTATLRAMNEVNRDADLMNAELNLIDRARKGRS